jgi:hypothetical protein
MHFELPYFLVRYSPDDLRGELFNVGVAVIAPPHLTLSLDLGAPARLAPFLPAGQTLDLEGVANGVRDHVGGALLRAIEAGQPVALEALLAAASRAMDGRVLFSAPGRIEFDCDESLLIPAAERVAQVILARCVRTEHLGAHELQIQMPTTGDELDQIEFRVHAPMPDWMRNAPTEPGAPGPIAELARAPSPSQRVH